VHGWRESCKTEWVGPVLGNLLSHVPYRRLVRNFEPIVDILTHKLRQLETDGFKPEDGYMFGFSFGAHIALHAALNAFGENRFGEIDLCEPAGPGFDGTMRELKAMSLAAKNVQCIHTSNTLGTRSRSCHQDWNMGHCGDYQVGAMPSPKGHHGLCPYFYANAFDHPFYAVKRPDYCLQSSRVAPEYPEDFQMGYMETRLP
jgi:Lipase